MADIAGANAYFAQILRGAAWLAYPDEQRALALSEAAGLIDGLPYARRPPAENLDHATYEQAYCLLAMAADQPGQQAAAARAAGVKSRSVADAAETYATAAELADSPGWRHGVFYEPRALALLAGYLRPDGAARRGRVVARHGLGD